MENPTIYKKNIKGDKSTYVLEVHRSEYTNGLTYVMYSERNGKEQSGTRVVKQRLSKETKDWYIK